MLLEDFTLQSNRLEKKALGRDEGDEMGFKSCERDSRLRFSWVVLMLPAGFLSTDGAVPCLGTGRASHSSDVTASGLRLL